MIDYLLLLGAPLVAATGYSIWNFWVAHRAARRTETLARRREDARDWQRRLHAGLLLDANFLQPTQNEILETLDVLDHLTPAWESGDPQIVEQKFLDELALNFPTLRQPNGKFPLPAAESPAAVLPLDQRASENSPLLDVTANEIARRREEFRSARAQLNALAQMATAAGSLSSPMPRPDLIQGRNLWRFCLIGTPLFLAAILAGGALWLGPPDRHSPVVPDPLTSAESQPPSLLPAESAKPAAPASLPTPPPAIALADPAAVPIVETVPVAMPARPRPSLSTQERAALDQQVATSKQRAVGKYPDLAVAGSEINLRFVFRYKNLIQAQSPRLLDPTWPEQLVEECAEAAGISGRRNTLTQLAGARR